MVPTPISTHLVQTIFQYILPPNLPLPPHLLSTPCLKRHHYLSISPADVAAYLCWPSSSTDAPDQIVQLLEHTSLQDMSMTKPEHQVRYTASDEETLLAHVRPDPQSPLRVVFMWDMDADRWAYHDCRLMPYPPSAHSDLDAALAARLNASSRSLSRSSSPDSDYWGGYASSDTSPNIATLPTANAVDDEKAEAAYWASYGAVHGSGDSTVPSPRPPNHPIPDPTETQDGRTEVDPFLANLHLRLHNQQDFLSPRYPGSERSHSPLQPAADPVSGPSSDDDAHNKYGFSDVPEIKAQEYEEREEQSNISISEKLPIDAGLEEVVKGLYRMWKGSSESRTEEDFIAAVRDALYS